MPEKPLILLTNDDGINAKGIKELIEAVKDLGELVVVAPEKGHSAKSHSVTMEVPLYLRKIKEENDLTMIACSGTPADAIKIAIHTILKRKPDLILSGINHGSNSSVSIVYSGTMAAAIEGTMNGIPSIGFSLCSYDGEADFTAAKKYVRQITEFFLNTKMPKDVCLNVNIPYVKPEQCNGIRVCRQADGYWAEEFDKRSHQRGFEYYWLTGEFINREPENDTTDEWALKHNYVSIVPIKIDFTSHSAYDTMKGWNF